MFKCMSRVETQSLTGWRPQASALAKPRKLLSLRCFHLAGLNTKVNHPALQPFGVWVASVMSKV
eukprot:2674535-Pyramimonas_sp.AAC.3